MFNFDLVAGLKCVFLIIWELKVLYHERWVSHAYVQPFFPRYRRPAPVIVNLKRWVSSAFSSKYACVVLVFIEFFMALLLHSRMHLFPLEARCCFHISVALTLKEKPT